MPSLSLHETVRELTDGSTDSDSAIAAVVRIMVIMYLRVPSTLI